MFALCADVLLMQKWDLKMKNVYWINGKWTYRKSIGKEY